MPFSYPLFRHPQVRRAVHGNYLIFFRVEATSVQVLRFIHGKRDLRKVSFGTTRSVDDMRSE